MIIKKRPIITWLLNPEDAKSVFDIQISNVANPINHGLLYSDLMLLRQIRDDRPDWGLPELIMPSFAKVMEKSERSFEKLMPELFKEFSKAQECGILLYKRNVTLVYGFGGNELHIWCFNEQNGKSMFSFYTCNKYINGYFGININRTVLADELLFNGPIERRKKELAFVANFIVIYLAVKKYIQVETIIVPEGKFNALDNTPLEYDDKKMVINYLGQEVIVMDSRWFRKIVNENDIYVRGFWRLQNKKNKSGEWYKELIFVNPFVRHGYHRNAKIEDVIE